MKNSHLIKQGATAVALAVILGFPAANAAEVYLKAGQFQKTIPYGSGQGAPAAANAEITMWGFCETDANFDCLNGTTYTSPGPEINVPENDTELTVYLQNTLPDATSVMIVGQANAPLPPNYTGSLRTANGALTSFVPVVESGATGTYDWTLTPGTYLYQSGTHVQKQVHMGLYGAVVHDAPSGSCGAASCAYDDVAYDTDAVLIFSEIDPALHNVIGADGLPDGAQPEPKPANATVNGYRPQFFLINGEPYVDGSPPALTAASGDDVLLRVLNAGLDNRSLQMLGGRFELMAEDGRRTRTARSLYNVLLPAAKSMDLQFSSDTDGLVSLYDRRLALVNGPAHGGGMFTQVQFGAGNVCTDCVNFAGNNASFSSGQDIDQNATVSAGGLTISLAGNTWRRTLSSYNVTPNTRLEFTYESTVAGEINGIGFDADTGPSPTQSFRLAGSQNWGINDFVYNGSGPQSFDIPVGTYFTGSNLNLILISDQDSGTGSNATFSNVRIYEAAPSGCTDCVNFSGNHASYSAGQDISQNATVSSGGLTISLAGNTWRRTLSSYNVTPNTRLEFTYESTAAGEINGIGFDADTGPSPTQSFRLAGSQNWGINDFVYNGSGQQSFDIPVGTYFTGSNLNLILISDQDSGTGSNATFSSVRIFEGTP